MGSQHVDVTDIVGIGFGPSNLALAAALHEWRSSAGAPEALTWRFFERQPSFGWHRGMLIDGATLQVSYLKDLVLLRNPTSRFSFLSYLHAKGRLVEFINSQTIYPTRVEFHDYLEWVAQHLHASVSYASEIVEVRPVVDGGVIAFLDVVVRPAGRPGQPIVRRARNVVVGTGLEAHLPDGVRTSDRIWHSSQLLYRAPSLVASSPKRIVVVGSGQSAAEVVEYLHRTCIDAEVCSVFSRYGYSVADDSPFTNGIFDPDAVDVFFDAREDVKKMMLAYHSNTNYSVVDLHLSRQLYRRYYDEKVSGKERLRFMRTSRVLSVEETPGSVRLQVQYLPTGAVETLDSDAIIYATGYRPSDPRKLFGDLASELALNGKGWLVVNRDHRVVTSDAVRCGIYVQGALAEHSHGLSAGLLSNAAVRAGEIVTSIVRTHADGERTSGDRACMYPPFTKRTATSGPVG